MRIPLLALSLIGLGSTAHATPVRFDFLIDGTTVVGSGLPSGSANGSGYVVFDSDLSAVADATGHVGDGHTPLPTIDLTFDWLGQHYDATNATLGAATFAGGLPIAWQIDSLAESPFCSPSSGLPFDRFGCVQFGTADFTLTGSAGGTGFSLLSWVDQSTPYARADVTWTKATTDVPEPPILGLMIVGIAFASLRRRRSLQA